ncbi:hypothetical protein EVG20_g8621 [Dentipellis fragilis]|uniref:Uncharacterized protein n=1 Tax=Dentipellis fragilis TaxID=205917 RepID=A0A4Y9Y531_9AGAM|nr:hypothetical protein EVG20_g8621 [Dentipellis fragilis]
MRSDSIEGEENEDPVYGDWGPSTYNDGEGIIIKLEYFLYDNNKDKRRKNVKAPCINKSLSIHEDFGLSELIVTLVESVGRLEILGHSHLYHTAQGQENADEGEILSLSFSIYSTSDKNLDLASITDYDQMMKLVMKRKKPQLVIMARELHAIDNLDENDNTGTHTDREDNEEQEEQPARKKKKKEYELSSEETEQDEIIIQLKDAKNLEGLRD